MNTDHFTRVGNMVAPSFLDNPRLAMRFRVRRIEPEGRLVLPHYDAVVVRSPGVGNSYTVLDTHGVKLLNVRNKPETVIKFLERRYSEVKS